MMTAREIKTQPSKKKKKRKEKPKVYLAKSHDTCQMTPNVTACVALISPSCSLNGNPLQDRLEYFTAVTDSKSYRKDFNLKCRQVKDMIHCGLFFFLTT